MGIVLMVAMIMGALAGLISTTGFGVLGMLVARRQARIRCHVWPVLAVVTLVMLVVVFWLAGRIPQAPTRGGSDYDLEMRNLFVTALVMVSCPGLALLLAAPVTFLCPRRPSEPPRLG